MTFDRFEILATAAKMAIWLAILLGLGAPIWSWVERRGSAMMQDRPGPNRVGPFGLLQAIADAVKFIFKETLIPAKADKPLYLMAPALAIIPALTTYVVVPLGPTLELAGRQVPMIVSPADTGVLLLLALSSMGVYSLVLAGYSSNNKWSLMGSMRASAQLISYELALTLSVVATLLPAESLRLDRVVEYQIAHIWNVVPQFLGFLVFLIASFAETNRLPFDLPEAESELVGGYHTEYGGMRFALFFMGEYMAMMVLSALCVTLFFGGWSVPGFDRIAALLGPVITFGQASEATTLALGKGLTGILVVGAKSTAMMFFFVWVRWTFPRFRYDQLMRLGWKVLLPLAIVNLLAVATMTLAGWL